MLKKMTAVLTIAQLCLALHPMRAEALAVPEPPPETTQCTEPTHPEPPEDDPEPVLPYSETNKKGDDF